MMTKVRPVWAMVVGLLLVTALPGALGFSVVGTTIARTNTPGTRNVNTRRSSLPATRPATVYSPWKPQPPPQCATATLTKLGASAEPPDEFIVKVKVDPLVLKTSELLRRLSWLAWWSQLILTTVSSVTLLFAKNVIGASNTGTIASSVLPNFLLAGTGIGLSFGSIFWTWANRRLAGRLLRKPTSKLQAATMLRKSIKVGVTLNLFGMLTSLISAEQIVGALAIKVLTSAPARTTVALLESSSAYLQPLDILVVQANTNTLFSHFSSLAALLYMTKSLARLDPPSSEGKER